MKIKRIAVLLLSVALLFCFCGCSAGGDDWGDNLLKPPRPIGDMYDIQLALEKAVTEKYTLKYPTSGDYRSAILQKDINGDGAEEAIAFYSTTNDNTVTMHINLITKNADKWQSVGDFKCVAGGVETVDFKDMNADGKMEIIVGWTVYSTVDKTLGVYGFDGNRLLQHLTEEYTHYLCEDIDGDGKSELFVSHLDAKNQKSHARLVRVLEDNTILELGNCILDNTVTSYYKPVVGKMPNGNPAIYFDAAKGSGTQTEILEITNVGMVDARLLPDGTSVSTYRASGATIRDMGNDGIYEIPVPVLLTKNPENDSENVYRTDWFTLQEKEMVLSFSALMNYVDGYYIVVPEKWNGKITVTRDTPNRIRNIMAIDEKTGNSADILVRVQTLPIEQKHQAGAIKIDGAVEIARGSELCYMVSVGNTAGDIAVTVEEFTLLFKILE